MSGSQLTFVGNEGVVLRIGERTIAIDAFFGDGAGIFASTPPEVIRSLETAQAPFDDINLILATHHHRDHFNPVSVGTHLLANPKTEFLSTRLALELMETRFYRFTEVADRVHVAEPAAGDPELIEIADVRVLAFHLSHGIKYGDIEHLGMVIETDDRRVVHLGDGIIDERGLRENGILGLGLDVGVLPFWFFTYPYGRRLIKGPLRCKQMFGVHIPSTEADEIVAAMAESEPAAIPLLEPLETHPIS